jgi:hypothetical protein
MRCRRSRAPLLNVFLYQSMDGLRDAELAAASSVGDAVFVHTRRFVVATKSCRDADDMPSFPTSAEPLYCMGSDQRDLVLLASPRSPAYPQSHEGRGDNAPLFHRRATDTRPSSSSP